MTDAQIAQEYTALFGGLSKPEVYLYGSHFLSGFLNEKPLARLRHAMETLGLQRDDSMSETEDHFACLCEVMRYLIAGDDMAVANLTRQREFFSSHIQPWVLQMCDDICKHPQARFYGALAEFTLPSWELKLRVLTCWPERFRQPGRPRRFRLRVAAGRAAARR